MLIKTAKTADSVLMNLASIALDPKVIGYVIKYPSNNKRKQDKYKFVKTSNIQNLKTPKAKQGVIETPTRTPFDPNRTSVQAIQKTQSAPKIHVKDMMNPKPTYQGLSVGQMVKIDKSFNAPFKKIVGIFNVNKKY